MCSTTFLCMRLWNQWLQARFQACTWICHSSGSTNRLKTIQAISTIGMTKCFTKLILMRDTNLSKLRKSMLLATQLQFQWMTMTNCFISTTFRENQFTQTPLTPTNLWLTTVLMKKKFGRLKWLATINRQCQISTRVTSTRRQEWTTFHGGLLNLQLPLSTKTRSFRKWCSSGTGEKDLKQSRWSTRWSTTTSTGICGIHRRLKSKVILDGLGINSRKSFWKMCMLRIISPRPPSTTWTTKKSLTRSTDTRSHSSSTTATLRAHSWRPRKASTSWVR